jgi:hypothetical protein
MTAGNSSKKVSGLTHLVSPLLSGAEKIGSLLQFFGFHFPIELGERIEDDPVDHRLNGRVILRRVIRENARDDKRQCCGRPDHRRDASGRFALPVSADD